MTVKKPYDEDDDSNLANISEEHQNLICLIYNVVYPDMKWKSMVPLSMFPSSLFTLTLSGLACIFEWFSLFPSMFTSMVPLSMFPSSLFQCGVPRYEVEKYLALMCNTELPVSISNLLHLQFLIINSFQLIIKPGVQPYLPMEIRDMQNLQFLQVATRDLPTPNSDSNAMLEKVSYILGMGTKSCTLEILKRIPNLRYLALISVTKPYDEDDDSNSLSGLANISVELQKLVCLTYIVLYPDMKWKSMVPLSMFPSSLSILSLSGLGYPWPYMNDIGSMLPNLNGLTLRGYAFQGPKWDIELRCFLKLEALTIEDTDLVQWRAQHGSLPRLKLLSIRYCYKLKHLDWTRDSSMVRPTIELVDCNPVVYVSAAKLPESLFAFRCYFLICDEKSQLDSQLG